MSLPQPLLPGFHPDPSIVEVDGLYYVVTSTFEYLPGIPVYRSADLTTWELVSHVVTRAGQTQCVGVPTGGGIWAPTIRFRDGVFYVIVTEAMGRGMLLFTTTDPAGVWDDGVVIALEGIDPDLAWDDEGTAIVTYSAIGFNGPHLGIVQSTVDLTTGATLSPARSIWSGTGLMFPEAPHLYRIGEWWYLLIAEGGTERGHTVSVARSRSPYGPFDGCPANPVLSARSTDRPIQNTGHGDLFQGPDGSWYLTCLGMRVRGLTRSFSSLGRETFQTPVDWVDGWPIPRPVLAEGIGGVNAPTFSDDFRTETFGLDWIGVRRLPATVGALRPGALVLRGEGRDMSDREPTFVGRRQRRLDAVVHAKVDGSQGVGGLCVRYDEVHHYEVEIRGNEVIARVVIPTITHEFRAPLRDGITTLFLEMVEPSGTGYDERMTGDLIRLGAIDSGGERIGLAEIDGRFLTAETACSFTGRVIGVYCVEGTFVVHSFSETGVI